MEYVGRSDFAFCLGWVCAHLAKDAEHSFAYSESIQIGGGDE